MASENGIGRYRRWYRKLLGCYPRPYRERFAEGMEQTFHDLCRERAATGEPLCGFVFWLFADTLAGILRENTRVIIMQTRIVRVVVTVGLILLIPLLGNTFVEGWNWGIFDFVIAGGVLLAAGLVYQLVARPGVSLAYRLAVAIACMTALLLFWINAAVGIIGDVDLANAMYAVVFVVGVAGAIKYRFEPRGMARTLFLMAIAQLLIPLLAMTWVPEEQFSPGRLPVMILNTVFASAWIVSALLFRLAGDKLARAPV